MTKKKLIIIEPECKSPSGHGLGSLEQYYKFFKKNQNVICVTNKKLKTKYFFSKKILNHFSIGEEYFKLKNSIDLFFIIPKYFFFLIKSINLLFQIFLDKKINIFLKCFFFNSFKIPRYLPDLVKLLKKIKAQNNDNLFIPSGRPITIQALYFLINIYPEIFPFTHFRIVHPIKWKKNRDNFFIFLNFFKKKNFINTKIFFYAENEVYKKSLEKFFNINTVIFNGLNYSQNNKIKKKNITIGFLGESKKFKGFAKIPKVIEKINKKKLNVNFVIQVNNPEKNLIKTIKKLILMSKKFSNIKIYNGKLSNNLFNKLLNKIDILPLIYEKKRAKTFGSGFIYTAIGSGISLVIPKGVDNWTNVINGKSYLEATNLDDYVKKISLIINRYPKYMGLALKTKRNYFNDLNKNLLIQRIINNKS